MNVLVACEYSGRVRDAFLARGHNAYSCDIEPTYSKPERHYHCEVERVLSLKWDLLIAHPPCTYLAVLGCQGLYTQKGRWERLDDAIDFFNSLLDCDIPKRCIENPKQHCFARDLIPYYNQIIQPWQFGDLYTKFTTLWLRGLPLLKPSVERQPETKKWVAGDEGRALRRGLLKEEYLAQCHDKQDVKTRSLTFQGIADAMAEQWG